MTRGGKANAPGERLALAGMGGITLVGEAWGDPGAPPALLLHGGGQTRHAWGGTARALATDGWRAIAVDLRGHGDSAWAEDGDYSFEAFAADVAALARRSTEPPVLVGASLGGISSLIAIGELGAPARALVLVDVAARIERDGVQRIVGFMTARPEGFASLEEAADAIAAYNPHRQRPPSLAGLAKNLRRGEDGRWRWHWDPRFIIGRAPRSHEPGMPERMDAAARAIRIPTLLVRGQLSDLLSEQGARHFLELVPHARFVDVSDAGHMVAGDRNDRFTDAVRGFLRAELAAA
jgi:non-heme chloroperoxidase